MVVKLQDCVKAQQNEAYAQKVKLTNLQQMANTLIFLQENNYNSIEQLKGTYDNIMSTYNNLQTKRNCLNQEIKDLNKHIYYLGRYYANRQYGTKILQQRNPFAFRKMHLSEIEQYEEARKYLKFLYSTKPFPSLQEIQSQRNNLKLEVKLLNKAIYAMWKNQKQLEVILFNTSSLLQYYASKHSLHSNNILS